MEFHPIKVLTFDCYGTLIDWESGIFAALRPILQAHDKSLADNELLELYSELEFAAEQGEFRPYRKVLQSVVSSFGERLGFTPTEAQIHSLPDSLPTWQPFPDTVAALRKLKERFPLAVISNVDDDLFAASARHLKVPFDHIITAQQARCYKPGLKIFHLALEKIGIPPENIMHCGQSVFHDVIPATSLNMLTTWVNRPSPRPGAGAAKAATARPGLQVPNLETLAHLLCPEK